MNKFIYNGIIAIIITIIFSSAEQFYRIYNDILVFNLNIKSFLEQFVLHFIIISIMCKRKILITYSIIIVFVWFQFLHFAYFGTWIFPLEYYLFFTKFQETFDTFKTVATIGILPTILTIYTFTTIYFVVYKLKDDRLTIPFMGTALILLLIFIPTRVYVKDSKKGHRPNFEHYAIKNTFNNLGYLFGSIMPKKLSGNTGLEQPIIDTPKLIKKTPDVNIVMIMGESLNNNYMSLYDYKIKTTPFLDTLKNNSNFIYRKAISSGVVTDVAIPSFFNMIKKPDGVPQILSTNTCLFKMASDNGFNTYFHSAQAQDQLSHLKGYLCPKWINNYIDGTSVTNDVDTPALDMFLVDTIDKVDFTKSNFLVLHQRGSHTPFKADYPPEFEKFTKQTTTDKTISQNVLEYQNSVLYTDYVLSQIVEKIKNKTDKPTYFVFTSDHSTQLGDANRNGHGRLDYDSVYQVPFFVYGINGAKQIDKKFNDFKYISHYQISDVVSYLLGYKENNKIFNKKEDCYVCDSDISGLAGILQLSFDEKDNQVPKIIE